VLQEYLQKASQYAAPTDVPLSGFYAAQRQLGSELGADEMLRRIEAARPMQGMAPDTFRAWAEKNPDLAYREMLRREELAKRGVQ
jgi:ABC-type hemin transport system substrate-binding protein